MLTITRKCAGILTTVLLVPGASSAYADGFRENCPSRFTSHGVQEHWRDLGNGLVAYENRSFNVGIEVIDPKTNKVSAAHSDPASQYVELIVESCASGKAVVVPTYSCVFQPDTDCTAQDVSLDISDATEAVLDEATSVQTSMNFDQLTDRFRKLSKDVSVVEPDGYESCACRVGYPRLRGDKVKYQ